MAMHKPRKQKRFQDGGLVDSEGRPVRDGSGQPIMTGFGREEAETQKRMQAAEAKLAGEVQDIVKARNDSERMSKDAEEGAKAPATSVKMPTRPGQGAKPKSGIVTKEELAKSGLTLREYMNKQQGKTARGSSFTDKAPSKTTPKAKPASTAKSDLDADQRKRSDMIVALTKAEQEATTPLAKQKIAESKRKMLDEYANAPKIEERKNYVPRPTPGARAPKQTTSKAKPYMPEKPDMSFRKGGSVSSASKRADGCAVRGKTKCKVY
jgi:hypothetical protein